MKAADMIRVVMADDHELFRDGFKLTLSRSNEITLVAEACDGRELLEMVQLHQPDVVITDIKMPRMDGIEAAKKISAQWPGIGIIGLSMFDEEDLIIEMLEAGARGYLVKNADKAEVIEAIKAVYENEPYYCRQTSNRLAQMIAKSKHSPFKRKGAVTFTDKELEIIQLICEENTNKEIADRLFISIRTVEGHRLRILEKMEVKNSIGMVIYAMQHELFSPRKT